MKDLLKQLFTTNAYFGSKKLVHILSFLTNCGLYTMKEVKINGVKVTEYERVDHVASVLDEIDAQLSDHEPDINNENSKEAWKLLKKRFYAFHKLLLVFGLGPCDFDWNGRVS